MFDANTLPSLLTSQVPQSLDPSTLAASELVAEKLAVSEWLGPLAPVALSPFFGLCVLSGIATYGPDWLQERSVLFQTAGPLDNAALFWTMLTLAVLTSLPRFTKVSKPLALAAENLETYSAVIILFVVRMCSTPQLELEGTSAASAPMMLSAGIGSFSINIAMSVAAGLNVIVINTVKLFFEVWLVPFPSVDAIIEVANKSLCVGLMALYCYSPTVATVVNLLLVVVCALVFRFVYRRLRFYRNLIVGPILAWLFPRWFAQRGNDFLAFVDQSPAGLARYTPVQVKRCSPNTWRIEARVGWKRKSWELHSKDEQPLAGLISQQVQLIDAERRVFLLTHRLWVSADALYSTTREASQALA